MVIICEKNHHPIETFVLHNGHNIPVRTSPNGAADHSQGIYPLVRSTITSSPNGATEVPSKEAHAYSAYPAYPAYLSADDIRHSLTDRLRTYIS